MTQQNLTIVLPGNDSFSVVSAGSQAFAVESAAELPNEALFAVPADEVRLLSLAVTAEEKKHLGKSLPFMVEEFVAEDIATLHIAAAPIDDARYAVAVIRRKRMVEWMESLAGAADEYHWVSEALLLPWQPNELTVLLDGDEAVIRDGEWSGSRIEKTLVPALLATMDAPTQTVIYGHAQNEDIALLPESWQVNALWRQGGWGNALMLADGAVKLDLRQGMFQKRLPVARWWGLWRNVAIFAAVALTVHLIAGWLDYRALAAENFSLRTAMVDSYRRANPKGAVVDIEKQLNRQLAEFQIGDSGPAFTPILADVSRAMVADKTLSLASLNFSGPAGQLRLTVEAPSFEAVSALRDRLSKAGLSNDLEGSNARSGGVTARLTVGVN